MQGADLDLAFLHTNINYGTLNLLTATERTNLPMWQVLNRDLAQAGEER